MELPKVLYVDDEILNLRLFEINLSKHYTIFKALNGNEGLEVLKNNQEIKLVLSDLRMPKMMGLEFIAKAKKITPNALFFLLSGFDITKEIQEALDSKLIAGYFKKPFNLNEIHKTLTHFTKNA
ncbi:MAG: response regulator [Flavobacteriaceae bacterium]|nr:response regulator [Flavobacteriaceae bacterium]